MSRTLGLSVALVVVALGLAGLGAWYAYRPTGEPAPNDSRGSPETEDSDTVAAAPTRRRRSIRSNIGFPPRCGRSSSAIASRVTARRSRKPTSISAATRPLTAIANDARHWELVLERLQAEEMPPEDAPRQPQGRGAGRGRRLDSRPARPGSAAQRRRPGDGAGPPAEQRRVRLHDPRPDRRRHPADARVPGRSRQRGRFRQLGRIARHVAGPAEEVPGGGPAGRRPRRPEAGRLRLRAAPGRDRHRPRQVLRPAASSTSTSATRSISPTTSWPPGSIAIATGSAGPTRS